MAIYNYSGGSISNSASGGSTVNPATAHGYSAGTSANRYTTVSVSEGEWLLVANLDRVTFTKNGATVASGGPYYNTGSNFYPALYCDGSFDTAVIYESGTGHRGKVSDSTLFIGDSYVQQTGAIRKNFTSDFYTATAAKGQSGWNAKYICGMITNVCTEGSTNYNSELDYFIKAGKFNRFLIWAGANRISSSETLAENTISANIPQTVAGSIKDLLDGDSITVSGTTVSTLADYYAYFGSTTIGQLAFLIEYIQAAAPGAEIKLCGYIHWPYSNTLNDADFIIGVYRRLSEFYSIPWIDTFSESGINVRNFGTTTIDNIHPSDTGCQLISDVLRKHC